eukprot:EG_transcript_347
MLSSTTPLPSLGSSLGERAAKPPSRLPGLSSPPRRSVQMAPSPLAPFEHLESLAEQSEIVDFQQLCKTLSQAQPAGFALRFRVQTKDSVFAEKTVGGDRWTVIARGLDVEHTVDGSVVDLGTGQYDVTVQVTKTGRYQVDLLLSKRIVSSLISNSVSSQLVPPNALVLTIHAGPISPFHSRLVFDGGQARGFSVAPLAGQPGYFLVKAKDKYSNPTFLGEQERLQVTCRDAGVRILGEDKYDLGVYKVTYSTNTAGSYAMHVHLTSPQHSAPVPIEGSPLTVTVLPDAPDVARCRLEWPEEYHAGDEGHCIAHLADRFGNPVDSAQLEVDTGSAHLTLRAVRNLKEEGRPGEYAIDFYTEMRSPFLLRTAIHSNAGIVYDTPIGLPPHELIPEPGQLVAYRCFDAAQLRGTAGVLGSILVRKRDRFGNALALPPDVEFSFKCDDPDIELHPGASGGPAASVIAYRTTKAKTYPLQLYLGGRLVEGGPCTLVIEPDVPDLNNSFLELPLAPGISGQPTLVWALLQDVYGNLTSKVDQQHPVTMRVSETDDPIPIKFAPNERFQARSGSLVDLTSNVSPEAPLSLKSLLNNEPAPDGPAPPIVRFNVPPPPYVRPDPLILHFQPDDPQEPVFAPTHSWLQMSCKQRPLAFVQCRVLSQSQPLDTSLWAVEYSDNGSHWVEAARLLQRNGWAAAEWAYSGEHLFWRLSCHNPHVNSEAVADDIDPPPPGVERCPCGLGHRRPQPSAWLSLEWYTPAVGRAVAAVLKDRTNIYDVTMQIATTPVAQCAATSFPLWINNTPSAAHSTVDLGDPQHLVVGARVSFRICLKGKFGYQRLVGSPQEMSQLEVRVHSPKQVPKAVELTNNQDGTYTATFDGRLAGLYRLSVKFANDPIPAPREFTLLPAPADPQKCVALPIDPNYEEVKRLRARAAALRRTFAETQAKQLSLDAPELPPSPAVDDCDVEHAVLDLDRTYGDGLAGGTVGRAFRFRLLARDEFYNHCTVPRPDLFSVLVRPTALLRGSDPDHLPPPTAADVTYEKDGYYGVCYTVQRAGAYTLDVAVRREGPPLPMLSAPLTMAPAALHPPACRLLTPTTDTPQQFCSGEAVRLVICLRDLYGNPLTHSPASPLTAEYICPWDRSEPETARTGSWCENFSRESAAPMNVWPANRKVPDHVVRELSYSEDGTYEVLSTLYAIGLYTVRLVYAGQEVCATEVQVLPGTVVPANCAMVSASDELRPCVECTTKTAMYFSRKCNQAYCDACWRVRHANPHRVGHRRCVVGVDDKHRRPGETIQFAVLTRDATGNVVVLSEDSSTVNVTMDFREYQTEPKARKDVKAKKKAVPLSCVIRHLEGHTTPVELLSTDSVNSVKRRIYEQERLPSNVQKLVAEGQVMEDNRTLGDYHLGKGSIIEVHLCDTATRLPTRCENAGNGLWYVQFSMAGYGHYSVRLTVGEVEVADAHHFILDAPSDELRGKAAQLKALELLQREVDDLRGRWATVAAAAAAAEDAERAA